MDQPRVNIFEAVRFLADIVDQINVNVSPLQQSDSLFLLLEAQGALAYWAAWQKVAIDFPQKDLPRVPAHWRTFGARRSPITGSPRHAANPANAMLNYLYALLESEARLAAVAIGLDPSLGFCIYGHTLPRQPPAI